MAKSFIQSSMLPAACIAGALFAGATVPFAMHKSEVIEIQMQNQPVVSAQLKDLAGPYLTTVGIFSAALGFGVMGVAGWRNHAQVAEKSEGEISTLKRALLKNQAELEEIKFSEVRLRAQNLDTFLEPASMAAAPTPRVAQAHQPQAAQVQTPAPQQAATFAPITQVQETPYVAFTSLAASPSQENGTHNAVTQQARVALAAAQSYASYHRQTSTSGAVTNGQPTPSGQSSNQLEELLDQIKFLTHQVEELRSSDSGVAA